MKRFLAVGLFIHGSAFFSQLPAASAPDDVTPVVVQQGWSQSNNIWFPAVFLGKDDRYKEKINALKKYDLKLYEEFVWETSFFVCNGWIDYKELNDRLERFYQRAAFISLEAIRNGSESFSGKLSFISTNEVYYQRLITDLTSHTNQYGLISREYAERAVSGLYWQLKFSSWYLTTVTQGRKLAAGLKNFMNTTVAPRARSIAGSLDRWTRDKRAQASDWVNKIRAKNSVSSVEQ